MDEPPAKKSKEEGDEPTFENYVLAAPSSAHSCFYFLVGDPKKGTPEKIPASKLLLMAHSVPMRKMLDESKIAEKDTVTLDDVEPDTFRNFVKFVSRCDIVPTFSFKEAVDLMYVAEKYMVDDLKDKLVKHIVSLITIDNVFLAMARRVCFADETLKNTIDLIIQQKTNDLVSREEFLQLNTFGVLNIVEQKVLSVTEIELWQALIRWARHNAQSEEGPKLREVLGELIKHVRFCTLDSNDFNKEVTTTDVLSDSEIASITKVMGGKTEVEKSPLICYEPIKRDFVLNSQIEIDFITSGFTGIDFSNSSYIYLTTKSQNIQLICAEVASGKPVQTSGNATWSGKVFLTRVTDMQTNTSSENPIEFEFSQSLHYSYSSYPIKLTFSDKIKLLPESKYKLEFSSSFRFQRYHNVKENFAIDHNGLVVHLNKDCPVTHFKSLGYKAL